MLATLVVRVTLISRCFLNREIREINVLRKFHVLIEAEFSRGSGRGDTCHFSFLDETLPD